LKKQIEKLTENLELIESKYKNKLEKKDLIIHKIDSKLQEYELLLKTNNIIVDDK